jgi:hypothetical protein
MQDDREAERAIASLNGPEWNGGRRIVVESLGILPPAVEAMIRKGIKKDAMN